MKEIYLIRHSAPFIDFENYSDYKNSPWKDCNRNMILSVEGERNAEKLCNVEELNNIDEIYSADSFRAIGTAKYVAEKNNILIKLDPRINERELGIEKVADLPENFTLDSFNNKDLKYKNGESLNEVDIKFNNFINEILTHESNKIVLSIHGMILLSFLQNNCDFNFDGKIFNIKYNDKEILNGKITNPDVYKLEYEDNKLINISRIEVL